MNTSGPNGARVRLREKMHVDLIRREHCELRTRLAALLQDFVLNAHRLYSSSRDGQHRPHSFHKYCNLLNLTSFAIFLRIYIYEVHVTYSYTSTRINANILVFARVLCIVQIILRTTVQKYLIFVLPFHSLVACVSSRGLYSSSLRVSQK